MSVYPSSLLGTSDEGEIVWRPHSEGKNRLAWTMQWRWRWVSSRGNQINSRKTLQLLPGNKFHKIKRCLLHCQSCTFYHPGKIPVPKCHDINMDDGKMRPDQKTPKCKNSIAFLVSSARSSGSSSVCVCVRVSVCLFYEFFTQSSFNLHAVSQQSLGSLLLSASVFTSLYSEHTSSNRRSTKYFVLFFWYGDKMFLKPARYKLYHTTQVRKNMQLQACFLRTLLLKNRLPTSFNFKIYFMYWILKL